MDQIPDKVKEQIKFVAEYVGNFTSDWLVVKRELIYRTTPKNRSLFSRRHYRSKKHVLSSFDLAVIDYWKTLTGVELKLKAEMIHRDELLTTKIRLKNGRYGAIPG